MLAHAKSTGLSFRTGVGVGLSVNADKTSMVLFTNNRKLVGFKKPLLFGTELQLKNPKISNF
jgi:hypothetical protein